MSPHATAADRPGPQHAQHLVPAVASRTRRHHGTLALGGQVVACVCSERRAGPCNGVSFELRAGPLKLDNAMTPAQARSLAHALSEAADVAEGTQGGAL